VSRVEVRTMRCIEAEKERDQANALAEHFESMYCEAMARLLMMEQEIAELRKWK